MRYRLNPGCRHAQLSAIAVFVLAASCVTSAPASRADGQVVSIAGFGSQILRCPGMSQSLTEYFPKESSTGIAARMHIRDPKLANLINSHQIKWGRFTCGRSTMPTGHNPFTMRPNMGPVSAGSDSPYWSGYQYNSGSAPWGVEANWNLPRLAGHEGTTNDYLAEWVGMGSGNNSSQPLVQAGTETDANCTTSSCSAWKQVNYTWIEAYPNANSIYEGPAVAPGQNVYAQASMPSGQPSFLICNESTSSCDSGAIAGTSTKPEPYQYEWIVERPGVDCSSVTSCSHYEITNYNYIVMTSAYWEYSVSGMGQMSDSQVRYSMNGWSQCTEGSVTSFTCRWAAD